MSQTIWSTINPATTSGTQLATFLNNFKEAMTSGMSGVSRPAELDAQGMWVDISADPIWYLKMYNGTSDITLMTIDSVGGTISSTEVGDILTIKNQSDSATGPILKLAKMRVTGDQSKSGDTAGQVDFYGKTELGVEEVVSRIESKFSQDTNATQQGSTLSVYTTEHNTTDLTERVFIGSTGKVGLGNNAPDEKLHVTGNIKSSGKVLVADVTESTDKDTGAVIIEGGVGVEKSIFAGIAITAPTITATTTLNAPAISISATTESTDKDTGALVLEGGLGVEKNLNIGGAMTIASVTESTTKDTGALVIEGGVGIEKNLNVGGDLAVTGNFTVSGTVTSVNSTDLNVTDKEITFNNGGNQASADSGAGLRLDITDGTDALIRYNNASPNKFDIGNEGSVKPIASTTGQEVFTNKDIDGGTASNTSRITLPKDTTANLDALTDKAGTVMYDTTLGDVVYNDGTENIQAGKKSAIKFAIALG